MSRAIFPAANARTLFRPRPFFTAVTLVTLLIATSYLRDVALGASVKSNANANALLLRPRSEPARCQDVHHAEDVCAFVRANCHDEQPGLIPYLNIYYCTFGYARIAGITLLVLWLGLLFSTIGIAASDFFTPNLQTIASVLSMPENLTGVTFLALGNGSPDLFSTVMSMRSNSAALAVGELIGAASFITAIVAGSIAMTREFKVDKQSFVRDLIFFVAAVLFTLGFLLDGTLRFYECVFMIVYYASYVVVVSGSHFYLTSKARRLADAEERARAVEAALRVRGEERYQDQRESAPTQPPGAPPAIDITTPGEEPSTEPMPRIEIEGAGQDVESEQEHSKRIGAEIANSMRVRRPPGSRRNTGNLTRPSLVGALELNSALERFRREGQFEEHPARPPGHARRHSTQNVAQFTRRRHGGAMSPILAVDDEIPHPARDRAISHAGNTTAPIIRHGVVLPTDPDATFVEGSTTSGQSTPDRRPGSRSLSKKSFQLDGNLAVPPPGQAPPWPDRPTRRTNTGPRSLEIPRRQSTSSERSEALSPFPGFTDSPRPMTPTSEAGGAPPLQLPLLSAAANIINNNRNNFNVDEIEDEDYDQWKANWRWWPYSILPAPEAIVATLFPTLQNWSEKGAADAFLSALSVPSMFLLSITLPVVDTRGPDPDEESEATRLNAGIEAARLLADTEWDEFRRHRQASSRGSSARASTRGTITPLSPMSAGDLPMRLTRASSIPKVVRGAAPEGLVGADLEHGLEDDTSSDSDELMGWNKWQVLLQVIAGPPFATFIITSLLLEQPGDVTLGAVRWSMVVSGALFLAVLLTTKQGERPRFHSLLCFPGFLVSVAWIAAIAGEVVGALKAIGIIWSISEAILGLTIFAAGNSVGDWVSNYTIARLGSPVMAFSGCIGGPMLNILLGLGSGGLLGMASKSHHKHEKHPSADPITWEPYRIQIGGSLAISAATLLVTLLSLLVFVPRNKWVFSRRLGAGLIVLWCITTGVNLVIEAAGVWTEVV
ncbi:related to sodium-calcium exchangers [Cephalotrichum gorgonifer]|uniref:Related to sodium-calcium exchangers n=1 Tax=Cephalotrichum gorgonifer TaxID=2041049 RepID=A0AAE8STP7_9PEZI|nr:related to sodium-calcium exchangers [Cephalotrichum gorgonifer]